MTKITGRGSKLEDLPDMLQGKMRSEQMRVKHNGKNGYVLQVGVLKCLRRICCIIQVYRRRRRGYRNETA